MTAAGIRLTYRILTLVLGTLTAARLLLGLFAFALPAGVRERWLPAVSALHAPAAQTLVELGSSLLAAGLGVALLLPFRRDRPVRLVGVTLLAFGGTGTLWIQAAASAMQDALGLPVAATSDIVLQSVTLAAFTSVLLGYPAGRGVRPVPTRDGLLTAVGGAAVLGAAAAMMLPPLSSYVVLFGVSLPALGLVLLRHRRRDDLTAVARTQIRLLFGVLVGLSVTGAALHVLTVAVAATGRTGLTLSDPTAPTGPLVLPDPMPLFWFSRFAPILIAAGVLTCSRRDWLHALQRRVSVGLVITLVAAVLGSLFVVLRLILVDLVATGRDRWWLAAAGAAVPVALLLQPTFARVERWVDRLMYGRRPTPYSVLAGIGSASRSTVTSAPDLSRVAEAVGTGLGARVCRVVVHRPDRPDRIFAWADTGIVESDPVITVPIVRGAEHLGALIVDRQTAAGLSAHRHRLVEDVADSLGAVLEARRLGVELERQLRAVRAHAADIAGSRRRLVAEMDAERRRIERDLHDGAQHHLVSLQLSLGLVEHRVTTGCVTEALSALNRVADQIDATESVIARTAVGVASPVLVQQGLVAALESEVGDGRPDMSIAAIGMSADRRFPADLESAVWFCCLEAVNNARKYAPGAPIRLTLTAGADRLEFSVHDDGPGWDMTAGNGSPGRGMRNVIARVTAVGGLVSVRSDPGVGTCVDGWVPLPAAEAKAAGIRTPAAAVREVAEQALTSYGAAPPAAKVRTILAELGASVTAAGDARTRRRTAAFAAQKALGALEMLIRDEPPATGATLLSHRLDRLRSESRELAEVGAVDTLRSDPGGLGPDDVEAAARLLGESGPDPWSRLGLDPDADHPLVVAAAERALSVWRARAANPGTDQGLRLLAEAAVRTCEHLLHGP